jgi:hypothetical protein
LASGKKNSKGQVKASKETSIENQALLLQERNKKYKQPDHAQSGGTTLI